MASVKHKSAVKKTVVRRATLPRMTKKSAAVKSRAPQGSPPRMPAIFGDHMVLQRDQRVRVWGWAGAGERVTVRLGEKSVKGTADAAGAWRVEIGPFAAGGPYRLTVESSGGGSLVFKDVFIGEVWLCSGQSNMEAFSDGSSGFTRKELEEADIPRLRLFTVAHVPAVRPLDNVTGAWEIATPGSVQGFSGTAFAFGRELHKHLDMAVGLVCAAWGGSAAEAWVGRGALEARPEFRAIVERDRDAGMPPTDSREYLEAVAEWERQAYHVDPGNRGVEQGWASADHDESEWGTMDLPRLWETTGLDIDGAVWFRRTVSVPLDWMGEDLVLSLGPLDDFDTTYVNGVKVGGIGAEMPDAYTRPREYTVPGPLVNSERLVIAVRIFDRFGGGGFGGRPSQMWIMPVRGGERLRLSGPWYFRVELLLTPKPRIPPPPGFDQTGLSSRLYNGMIAPLAGYGMRGALWYQGESNVQRAWQYQVLLRTLIEDWRNAWGYDFPFLVVQLPNYELPGAHTGRSEWAELREAQRLVAASVPGVWMTVNNDTGNSRDIHPANKPLIGYRLALAARANVYGDTHVAWTGPRFARADFEDRRVRVWFTHDEGLCALGDGAEVSGFVIAGGDREFHRATAEITENGVVVHSAAVAAPVAVRYAWAGTPGANLANAYGLPAEGFRTDSWPLLTEGK